MKDQIVIMGYLRVLNRDELKDDKFCQQKANKIEKLQQKKINSIIKFELNKAYKKVSTYRFTDKFNNNPVLPQQPKSFIQLIASKLRHKNSQQTLMSERQDYQNQEFENDEGEDSLQEYYAKQRLRKQAYNRKTQYSHPPIHFFDHEQINSKQSQELRKELVTLYKPKVQLMRTKFDLQQMAKDYENHYQEFIKMTLKNQIQQRQLTESLAQMHEMADILLTPPNLQQGNLYLYSKTEPDPSQQQEIDRIFNQYETAYKFGEPVQQNHAQETIQKAKQFLRDRYT